MLNVALVGLLAGSLAVSTTDDGKKGTADSKPDAAPVAAAQAGPSIFTPSFDDAGPETVQDTYAFGIASRQSPIKLWLSYGRGSVDERYDTAGEAQPIGFAAGAVGEVTAQRLLFGGEFGLPVGLFGFGLSAGAQLSLSKNELTVTTASPAFPADLNSDFGLQAVKVYGSARAGAIGLHAGYQFDIADEQTFAPSAALGGAEIPTDLANSDGRDAAFFGADFDYPARNFRLFGGIDYYDIYSTPDNTSTLLTNEATDNPSADDDYMNALFGAGFKFSVFELGAALQIQARFGNPINPPLGIAGIGASSGTIAPYLRISPPSIPASIFVKGAVQDEYGEFGYSLGGSNAVKTELGFTVGLTVGFE